MKVKSRATQGISQRRDFTTARIAVTEYFGNLNFFHPRTLLLNIRRVAQLAKILF